MKNSNVLLSVAVFTMLVCSGCGSGTKQDLQSTAEQRLKAIWKTKGVSAKDQCAAINAYFTNGTPMRNVVAVLGKQDIMNVTTTLSWPPETQNRRIWVYWLGSEEIHIKSTGGPSTALDDRGFAGAYVVPRDWLDQPEPRSKPSVVGSNALEQSSLFEKAQAGRGPNMGLHLESPTIPPQPIDFGAQKVPSQTNTGTNRAP